MTYNPKYPEFRLLSEFLTKLGAPDTLGIHFREISDADNRYALQVWCDSVEFIRALAEFWGCPEDDLPVAGDAMFEASDSWHGVGPGDLRDLGDELGQWSEPFFNETLTVAQIHEIASECALVDVWARYKRKGLLELRPYVPGEDLTGVSLNAGGTPELGGMVARNPKNHADQWYVAKAYFEENLEPA